MIETPMPTICFWLCIDTDRMHAHLKLSCIRYLWHIICFHIVFDNHVGHIHIFFLMLEVHMPRKGCFFLYFTLPQGQGHETASICWHPLICTSSPHSPTYGIPAYILANAGYPSYVLLSHTSIYYKIGPFSTINQICKRIWTRLHTNFLRLPDCRICLSSSDQAERLVCRTGQPVSTDRNVCL